MVKRILNWNDRRFDELLDNHNDNRFVSGAKAFGIGAVEGLIDGVAIIGAVELIKSTVCLAKKIIKK